MLQAFLDEQSARADLLSISSSEIHKLKRAVFEREQAAAAAEEDIEHRKRAVFERELVIGVRICKPVRVLRPNQTPKTTLVVLRKAHHNRSQRKRDQFDRFDRLRENLLLGGILLLCEFLVRVLVVANLQCKLLVR